MARSPIPQLIEDFHQMSPEEQRCFLDLVDPQPEPPAAEKASAKKKRTRSSSKSPRASNLAATLGKNLAQQREAATKDITGEADAPEPICDTCGNIAGYVDHFQPSPSYHPFTVKGIAQAAGVGD